MMKDKRQLRYIGELSNGTGINIVGPNFDRHTAFYKDFLFDSHIFLLSTRILCLMVRQFLTDKKKAAIFENSSLEC